MHAFVVLGLVLSIPNQEIGLGNVFYKVLAQSVISCHNSQSELLLLSVLFQTLTVIVWVNLC